MNENIWRERWSTTQIKALLIEQFQSFWQKDPGVPRTQLAAIERVMDAPHAVIISGLRRVGKSTLLAQVARQLGEERFYYLNFEDDRFLRFQADDFNDLFALLVELFATRKIFIIDEIQNITGWEHFVRRFMDMGYKFYISGSNAALLSSELGTRLTGRYIPIELFPFSFTEFLRFTEQAPPDLRPLTTIENAHLKRHLSTYLAVGGIPDALKYPELPLLRTLYDDVLYRDIATRYRIEAVAALKELGFYLMSNPTSMVSYNKLKERFRLGSVNTIKSYIEYMANSWLLFSVNRYDFSVKRQQIAPKKIYAIDTGLANAVGFNFSPNTGKLLENLLFLALRRQTHELYYYVTPGGYEIDFYLPTTRQLIQVTQHLENPTTRERELRAIEDAIGAIPVESALIITENDEDPVTINGISVIIHGAATWLLQQQ